MYLFLYLEATPSQWVWCFILGPLEMWLVIVLTRVLKLSELFFFTMLLCLHQLFSWFCPLPCISSRYPGFFEIASLVLSCNAVTCHSLCITLFVQLFPGEGHPFSFHFFSFHISVSIPASRSECFFLFVLLSYHYPSY